jgi:hypothetical protein
MGMLTTSAIVATHAIQEAWSAEMEKAPPTSAMSRSTNWEEMLDPTIAMTMTAMVVIAVDKGGGPAATVAGAALDVRSVTARPAVERPIPEEACYGPRPFSAEPGIDAERAAAMNHHQQKAADDRQML